MAGVDDSRNDSDLIFQGTPAEFDAELRRLGVSGGVNGIREDGQVVIRAPEIVPVFTPDMIAAAARTMREQLSEFMAAQAPLAMGNSGFYAESVKVSGDRKNATAVGKMMFNNQWSSSFVHSSDMMFSAGGVVEALLNEGEEVVGVEALRFMNRVRNNVEWHASSGELDPAVSAKCAEQKPDVKATFLVKDSVTGSERKIQLFGFQNTQSAHDNPPMSGMASLPLSLSRNFDFGRINGDKDGNNIFRFDLSRPASVVTEAKLGASMNAVMELVMGSFSVIKICLSSDFYGRFGSLAYGFDFKKLPKVEELDQNCELEISLNRDRIVVKDSGVVLVPINFLIKKSNRIIAEGVYQSAYRR